MKGLEEVSSLVFLQKLLAMVCQDSFLSELVDKQREQRQEFIFCLVFQVCDVAVKYMYFQSFHP